MKVKHRASGQESTITRAEWDKIVENGFISDFQIMEDAKPPKEVQDGLKLKTDKVADKAE